MNITKTSSLRNLKDTQSIAYLNTDQKEVVYKTDPPMKGGYISDPYSLLQAIDEIEASSALRMGILDTLSYAMQQFEVLHIANAANGQKAWGEYANFYKSLIHKIKSGTKDYAILCHVTDVMNDSEMVIETKSSIKGSVGKQGIEGDFSIILATRKVSIKALAGISNPLLNITPDEEEDGFKYVFQTRIDKDSMGWPVRSPIGLWQRNEKYIDNDLNAVFERLHTYY